MTHMAARDRQKAEPEHDWKSLGRTMKQSTRGPNWAMILVCLFALAWWLGVIVLLVKWWTS